MSLSYTLRESLSGFTRTKLSSILSVLTISIALVLLGVFTIISVHAARFLDELRSRVELEVFLQEPITRPGIDTLSARIAGWEGVARVTYVSKEEAAAVFRKEFGEDILSVLDFNPLPPSLKVALKDGYKTSARARTLEERLTELPAVESVVYRKALLEVIERRSAMVHNITLTLGILVGLSAVFLVSNTIRLAISAKRQSIRTMELVGATRLFIRTPFLLEGILQGMIGGIIAAGILYALVVHALRFVAPELTATVRMEPAFYAAILLAGALLGAIGSSISVARFIQTGPRR